MIYKILKLIIIAFWLYILIGFKYDTEHLINIFEYGKYTMGLLFILESTKLIRKEK